MAFELVMSRAIGDIANLEGLASDVQRPGVPPVERWNPPYCGDIGIAIRRDGTWTYLGSPINRAPLVNLFASVLRRDEDGRYYLVTPAEKVLCSVEDAPFVAVEMEIDGTGPAQALTLRTTVRDVVQCGPVNALRYAVEPSTGGLKPYVLVRGRLEALLTRTLAYDFLDRCVGTGPDGTQGVWSRGSFFPLPHCAT